MSHMTPINLFIIWLGFSTMVWLGELANYVAIRFPRMVFIMGVPILTVTFGTVEYILVTGGNILPGGISTYFFSLDNAIGLMFLASISIISAYYLSYPILKIGLSFLPINIASEISLFKPPPTKGAGSIYVFIAFVVVLSIAVLFLNYFSRTLFGACTQTISVLCVRFSIFSEIFSNYLNTNLFLNKVFAQILALIGVLASILGVIKTIQEIQKNINSQKVQPDNLLEKQTKSNLTTKKRKASVKTKGQTK